jgi:hypothetical protein
MNYLDFLRDALVLGRALDVGLGPTEEAIKSAWGAGFLEDVHKRGRMKRWDYGLAEFSFRNNTEWVCTGFIIQLHRLAHRGNSIIPTPISSIYGEFPETVQSDSLADRLRDSGARLEEEQAAGSGFDMYFVPGIHGHLSVIQDDADTTYEGREPGEIWSISVEYRAAP